MMIKLGEEAYLIADNDGSRFIEDQSKKQEKKSYFKFVIYRPNGRVLLQFEWRK